MEKYVLRKIKHGVNKNIEVYLNKNIFSPNLTTLLLIKSLKKIIKKKGKMLELGCGSGIISNYFYKNKKIKKIFASDISKTATECAIFNANKINAKHEIKKSNLFNSWKGYKFDIIVNDISAISDKLNSISGWYDYAPNNSGSDGVKFTIKVLKEFKKYAHKNGKLIIPIIGLSNKKKIISFMKKNSIKHKILLSQDWPLPKKFYSYKTTLLKLKRKNIIDFENKFGFLTTKTEIYCCYY
jgi:methylase of polypeptide subunit release factors